MEPEYLGGEGEDLEIIKMKVWLVMQAALFSVSPVVDWRRSGDREETTR